MWSSTLFSWFCTLNGDFTVLNEWPPSAHFDSLNSLNRDSIVFGRESRNWAAASVEEEHEEEDDEDLYEDVFESSDEDSDEYSLANGEQLI